MNDYTPNNPFDEADNPLRRMITLAVSVILVLACCVFSVAAFLYLPPEQLTRLQQYFPSPTATPTITPTFTPTITLTPTLTPTPTPNRTAEAYEATAVQAAADWAVVSSADFETDDGNWYTGTDDETLASITYSIKDGKYIWDATSHNGFVQRVTLDSEMLSDFYFSVEAAQPGFTTAADYGITFREDADGNYYYFNINNKGRLDLWLYYDGAWTELSSETDSAAIQPRAVNQIAVLAEGDHFRFFINAQFVLEVEDDTLAKGWVGMAVEISEPNLNIIFEFDNVFLQIPE